jgi:hypothetical protein
MDKVIPRTYRQGYKDGRESLMPLIRELQQVLVSVQAVQHYDLSGLFQKVTKELE